jgi:hypothetical protein
MQINKNLLILLISIAVVGISTTIIFFTINNKLWVKTTQQGLQIDSLKTSNSSYISSKKYLEQEIKKLSSYKGLTESMIYRDICRSELKYCVGDFVVLKKDSSTVLVKDIIIGGNRFEHYIKYEVLYKNNTIEYISQDLLY